MEHIEEQTKAAGLKVSPPTGFTEEIEKQVSRLVIDNEYKIASQNKERENRDFEAYIDLIDSVREPRDYDWMSDIRLPEFISHVLTQSSMDVSQYFSTKDFVEAYVQDSSEAALKGAAAAKECINRVLNQRHLAHYQKFVRGKLFSYLAGKTYAMCWWEQETENRITGFEEAEENAGTDESGMPLYRRTIRPVREDVVKTDRFNYDILDPRNVFTDNKYCYTLQEKDWVIIRSEQTLEELRGKVVSHGYINLDKLGEIKPSMETKTSQETYNSPRNITGKEQKVKKLSPYLDVLERYGKFWVVGDGEGMRPGIDDSGNPLKEAVYVECIITFAMSDGEPVLIRFQETPYVDVEGKPYRPIIRGLCYIHPVDDGGMGDAKYERELQLALDDTFCLMSDRMKLATVPTLKTKKYSTEDNAGIYIEPGHTIELENPREDLEELKISDDATGALNAISMLRGMMQQVDSIYPTTMGDMPGLASTTATAIAGAEQRSNKRANYKSLTFENTFLSELYWMILQMTNRFAKPETGIKLMGDKIYGFDPSHDYYYKPVSQASEPEQMKMYKVKQWTQILSYVQTIPHPGVPQLINHILTRILEYMGDEYDNFGKKLLDIKIPMQQTGGNQQGVSGISLPMSNQTGIEQSSSEQMSRDMMGGMSGAS